MDTHDHGLWMGYHILQGRHAQGVHSLTRHSTTSSSIPENLACPQQVWFAHSDRHRDSIGSRVLALSSEEGTWCDVAR